jgi:predicted short-subunit dehydrogenase-like oxidoreductase (DUF2520 family)
MTSMHQSSRHVVVTATVVGAGRLGRPVARALHDAGVRVTVSAGRGASIEPADVVLLCVPDADIARVAGSLNRDSGFVGHMSGATPLVEAGVDFGLHPLQTFLGDEGAEAFRDIGCAVAGRSPEALAIAHELADRLGAHAYAIDDEHRAAYHASASLASNFVMTLLASAERLAMTAGLSSRDARMLISPLAQSTVRNWTALGGESALTGPISRGDMGTVERQRQAVAADAPELLALFDALCESTRVLAARGRVGA